MLLLADLDPTKKRVTVCVRVSRMWDYYKDNKLAHIDLILIDEMGTKMHAEIGRNHAPKFKELLQEGNVYSIRDFLVQSSKNMFRAVDGKFMMVITPWTKIELKTDVPLSFPRYAYSLTSFEHLPALVGKKETFIDVIGIVTSMSKLLRVRLPGQSHESLKRSLHLIDIDGRTMDAALWGVHATDFDAEKLYDIGQSEPLIILLVGMLMKNYLNRDTISCGDAGKFYINPEIPEKDDYCLSYRSLPGWHRNMIVIMDHLIHLHLTVKIEFLHNTDPNEYLGKSMICTITIIRLQSTEWWFLACNSCHKKAYPAGDEFVCSDGKCLCVAAAPRYKVRVIAADSTGEAEFVFFAGLAEQVIGKKIDLLRAAARRPDTVPAEITALVSQKYTLNISVNRRGLAYGELSFQVNSVDTIHRKSRVFEFKTLASSSKDQADLTSVPTAPQQSLSALAKSASGASTQSTIDDTDMSQPHVSSASDLDDRIAPTDPTKVMNVPVHVHTTPPSVTKAAIDAGSATDKKTLKRPQPGGDKTSTSKKLFKQG